MTQVVYHEEREFHKREVLFSLLSKGCLIIQSMEVGTDKSDVPLVSVAIQGYVEETEAKVKETPKQSPSPE